MRWVAGVAVVVALAAAACANPDTSPAGGTERGRDGGVESDGPAEVVRAGSDAGENTAAESVPRGSRSAERDAAGVSDAAHGSGSSAGDRVEDPVVVNQGDPGEGAAGADAAPLFVELSGLAEAVADAAGFAGLISVGFLPEVCGVRPDRSVECWGESGQEIDIPEGPFGAVSTSLGGSCGLRPAGALVCWEYRGSVETNATPEGVFAAVGTGSVSSCGLRSSGELECWAADNAIGRVLGRLPFEAPYPGGVFSAVSVGRVHVCGLRPGGSVACWGEDWFGQSDPPGGRFVAVEAGVSHSCGLRPDGSVECWGEDSMDSAWLPRWFRAEGGERAHVDDRIDAYGGFELPQPPFTFMTAADVVRDAELLAAMVQRAAGWEPPPGPYKAIAAGTGFTCGLRLDGEVSCWGYVNSGEPRIPLAVYAGVAGERVRARHAGKEAALESFRAARVSARQDGGFGSGEQADAAADRKETALSLEVDAYSRMLTYVDLVNPPAGPFVAIDAGQRRVCGLRADGEIECWGYDYGEEPAPPPGPFATTPLATNAVTFEDGATSVVDEPRESSSAAGADGDAVVRDSAGGIVDVVRLTLFERPEALPESGCAGRWVPGRRVRSFGGTVREYSEGFAPHSTVAPSVVRVAASMDGSDVRELPPVALPTVSADAQGRIVVVWALPDPPQDHGPVGLIAYAIEATGATASGVPVKASSFLPHIVYPEVGPCAQRDDATTTLGRAVRIDVLANDVAPTAGALDPASVEVDAGSGRGEFTVDRSYGSITFTPSSGFIGVATASYTVSDSWGVDVSAHIRVTVTEN